MEQYQSGEEYKTDGSGEESDGDDMNGLESSDEDRTLKKDSTIKTVDSGSDEEYTEEPHSKNKVSEHIEFRDGRMRRKAVFRNELDQADLEVILLKLSGLLRYKFMYLLYSYLYALCRIQMEVLNLKMRIWMSNHLLNQRCQRKMKRITWMMVKSLELL